MTEITLNFFDLLLFSLATLAIYQLCLKIQIKLGVIWLNPMLLSIAIIVPIMLYNNVAFEYYYAHTTPLSSLLEPAVVALGFPLYQHLKTIKYHWQLILSILTFGVVLTIFISFLLTIYIISLPEIAVSMSYKAVTTPIGIELTENSGGNSSITAFAIILAGLFGALLGPSWLNFINVKSAKAHGLAIGAASHALGTATISRTSYEHGAYGSLALIVSAFITAVIGPLIVDNLLLLFA